MMTPRAQQPDTAVSFIDSPEFKQLPLRQQLHALSELAFSHNDDEKHQTNAFHEWWSDLEMRTNGHGKLFNFTEFNTHYKTWFIQFASRTNCIHSNDLLTMKLVADVSQPSPAKKRIDKSKAELLYFFTHIYAMARILDYLSHCEDETRVIGSKIKAHIDNPVTLKEWDPEDADDKEAENPQQVTFEEVTHALNQFIAPFQDEKKDDTNYQCIGTECFAKLEQRYTEFQHTLTTLQNDMKQLPLRQPPQNTSEYEAFIAERQRIYDETDTLVKTLQNAKTLIKAEGFTPEQEIQFSRLLPLTHSNFWDSHGRFSRTLSAIETHYNNQRHELEQDEKKRVAEVDKLIPFPEKEGGSLHALEAYDPLAEYVAPKEEKTKPAAKEKGTTDPHAAIHAKKTEVIQKHFKQYFSIGSVKFSFLSKAPQIWDRLCEFVLDLYKETQNAHAGLPNAKDTSVTARAVNIRQRRTDWVTHIDTYKLSIQNKFSPIYRQIGQKLKDLKTITTKLDNTKVLVEQKTLMRAKTESKKYYAQHKKKWQTLIDNSKKLLEQIVRLPTPRIIPRQPLEGIPLATLGTHAPRATNGLRLRPQFEQSPSYRRARSAINTNVAAGIGATFLAGGFIALAILLAGPPGWIAAGCCLLAGIGYFIAAKLQHTELRTVQKQKLAASLFQRPRPGQPSVIENSRPHERRPSPSFSNSVSTTSYVRIEILTQTQAVTPAETKPPVNNLPVEKRPFPVAKNPFESKTHAISGPKPIPRRKPNLLSGSSKPKRPTPPSQPSEQPPKNPFIGVTL